MHPTRPHQAQGRAAPAPAVAPKTAPGAGAQLLDAVRRALRAPEGRAALVLHLSRLSPPAPRPHHRRIARVLLDDEAVRHEGYVHAMGNGDLVLLCRPAGEAAVPGLAATLARLFRADAPDPAGLTSVWSLAGEGAELLRYAEARLADAPGGTLAPPEPPAAEGWLARLGTAAALAPPPDGDAGAASERDRLLDLVRRRTAVFLAPREPRLRPLFREVVFPAAIPRDRDADPFLSRHFAGKLDRRALAALTRDLAAAGPMGAGAAGPGESASGGAASGGAASGAAGAGFALHLNLTVPGVLSDAFARFAGAARAAGVRVGAELALLDACADPAGFARAGAALREAGALVVLDDVSHGALALTRLAALRPDLVKLGWSPRMADLDADEALGGLDPERVVLHRADDEAAMSWGLSRGIRRFQGRHVDMILAASRHGACPSAAGCTLRRCAERAAAAGATGREGCHTPALLDAGVPRPAAAGRPAPRGGGAGEAAPRPREGRDRGAARDAAEVPTAETLAAEALGAEAPA